MIAGNNDHKRNEEDNKAFEHRWSQGGDDTLLTSHSWETSTVTAVTAGNGFKMLRNGLEE